MGIPITQEYLHKILDYNQETGIFIWKRHKPNVNIGDIAGHRGSNGYIYIGINNKTYLGHRLAWLYVTGNWPQEHIDHKNKIKNDNSFKNLRKATNSENLRNSKLQKNNTSGYRGVFLRSQIVIANGLQKSLLRENKNTWGRFLLQKRLLSFSKEKQRNLMENFTKK